MTANTTYGPEGPSRCWGVSASENGDGFELALSVPAQEEAQTGTAKPCLHLRCSRLLVSALVYLGAGQSREFFGGGGRRFSIPPLGSLLALLRSSLGAGTERRPGSSGQGSLCKTKAINFCPGQQKGTGATAKPAWNQPARSLLFSPLPATSPFPRQRCLFTLRLVSEGEQQGKTWGPQHRAR